MSHINTGITLFERRPEHYRIEGIDFSGWALLTWNDQAHLSSELDDEAHHAVVAELRVTGADGDLQARLRALALLDGLA